MEWFAQTCLEQAADLTVEFSEAIKEKVVREKAKLFLKNTDNWGKTTKKFLEKFEREFRTALTFEFFMEGSKKSWAVGNLDCWANFFPKGRYYYIVPMYPKSNKTPKYPPYVEEYGYWDNTDEPDNVTRRQWRTRAKNWEVATDDKNFHLRRLSLTIIDAKEIMNTGLYWVEKELVERGWLKSDEETRFSPSWIAAYPLWKEEKNEPNHRKRK